MSSRLRFVLKEALSLTSEERAEVAECLLSSLDRAGLDCHVDALWAEESEDRIDGFERGEIATTPAADVFDDLHGMT